METNCLTVRTVLKLGLLSYRALCRSRATLSQASRRLSYNTSAILIMHAYIILYDMTGYNKL